jgi:hypothetical protein
VPKATGSSWLDTRQFAKTSTDRTGLVLGPSTGFSTVFDSRLLTCLCWLQILDRWRDVVRKLIAGMKDKEVRVSCEPLLCEDMWSVKCRPQIWSLESCGMFQLPRRLHFCGVAWCRITTCDYFQRPTNCLWLLWTSLDTGSGTLTGATWWNTTELCSH